MKPVEFEQEVQKHGKELIQRILELTQSDQPYVALHACRMLWDRAYGVPAPTSRDPFTDDEKEVRLNETISQIFEESNDE